MSIFFLFTTIYCTLLFVISQTIHFQVNYRHKPILFYCIFPFYQSLRSFRFNNKSYFFQFTGINIVTKKCSDQTAFKLPYFYYISLIIQVNQQLLLTLNHSSIINSILILASNLAAWWLMDLVYLANSSLPKSFAVGSAILILAQQRIGRKNCSHHVMIGRIHHCRIHTGLNGQCHKGFIHQ